MQNQRRKSYPTELVPCTILHLFLWHLTRRKGSVARCGRTQVGSAMTTVTHVPSLAGRGLWAQARPLIHGGTLAWPTAVSPPGI